MYVCKRLSTNSEEDIIRESDEKQELTINAGQLVWAVAISSRTPFTKPRSTCLNWTSKKVDRAILAAGLQSGSIKVWEVKNGIGFLIIVMFILMSRPNKK